MYLENKCWKKPCECDDEFVGLNSPRKAEENMNEEGKLLIMKRRLELIGMHGIVVGWDVWERESSNPNKPTKRRESFRVGEY